MNSMSSFNKVNELINNGVQYEYIKPGQNVVTTMPDGTQVAQNDAGTIMFALYVNGAKLIRHDSFVLCANQSGEHWFGNRNQNWCRLD